MGDELPQTLYKSDPPDPPKPQDGPTPKPNTPISNFLEAHGTVVLLFSLVLVALAGTFYLSLHLKLDPEKVFAYFSGFCTGAFSTMALGMKVGNGTK